MRRCSCLGIYFLMYLIWNSWTSILRYQIRRDMLSSKNHEEYFNINIGFLHPFVIKLPLSLEEGKFFNCHFLFWAIFKIWYTTTPLKAHPTWTKFYPILTPPPLQGSIKGCWDRNQPEVNPNWPEPEISNFMYKKVGFFLLWQNQNCSC